MSCNHPFFRRAVRPAFTRPAYYLVSLGLGVLAACVGMDMEFGTGFFVVLLALFSCATTMRAVDDDFATGTLEQLDVLPVPRWRIVLETAAGTIVAYTLVASVAMGMALLGLRGTIDVSFVMNMAPVIPAMALMGTLPPLRHRMSWLGTIVFGALLLGLLRYVGPFIFNGFWTSSATIATARAPLHVVAYLAVWAVVWRIAHALGGGWSGGEAERAQRASKPCAMSCPLSRGTPDGYNPLFWRELRLGRGWLAVIFLLGILHIAPFSQTVPIWYGPFNRTCDCVPWIGMWLVFASAMRTSSDRLSGMWGDIAQTPVSLGSIVLCRVRGMLVQAALLFIGWATFAWAIGGRDIIARSDGWVGVLMVLCGYVGAILAGFCSGTSGRGVVAGFGGLVLMYLLGALCMLPGGLAVDWCWRSGIPFAQGISVVIGVVCGLPMFYGTLIWGSLRGINGAVESQRA